MCTATLLLVAALLLGVAAADSDWNATDSETETPSMSLTFTASLTITASLTRSPTLSPSSPVANGDADGDGVLNGQDKCTNTVSGAVIDGNGCSQAQMDADSDGICNADRPMSGGVYLPTNATWCRGADNCKFVANPAQGDVNSNGVGDACDTTGCHAACKIGCTAWSTTNTIGGVEVNVTVGR
jgi:hypothetical protein